MARSIFFYTDSTVFGGAEQALFMLIEELDRNAWAPTLLLEDAGAGPPLADHLGDLDVPVQSVPPMPLGAAGAARAPALARMLRRRRPDVFHASLSWPLAAKYGLAAAVVARVPATVATVQLFPEFELGRSSRWQMRALAAGVDRYIAVSRDIAAKLGQRMSWPAAKIEVVHNAVRLNRCASPRSAQLRDELSGGRERPVVLTIARLDPQKGHPVLLEAAARLPGINFALAGDGPERARLEAQAESLGLGNRVGFLGHRTDVPDLLDACDVFALPSLYEGSSLALLEAMAARRAVVSSAIGGTEELIGDGEDGLLVPPGDATALAAALRRLLADAALRRRLADRARQRAERDFSAAAMCASVTRIYDRLLADA
ncbi:MAG TPA: glycosyltransferase [Solirubrobacterales bacterium]|nr:glycosyltransferase [Solirubrobacterales bacterium]